MSTKTYAINCNYDLDNLCKTYAKEIVAMAIRDGKMWNRDPLNSLLNNNDYWCMQWTDSSEWCVNWVKAMHIISTCNTARGEHWAHKEMSDTYDNIRRYACNIVTGEIYVRTFAFLTTEMDRLAECDELFVEEV